MNVKQIILLLTIVVLAACSDSDTFEEKKSQMTTGEKLADEKVPVEFSVSDQRTIDFTRAATSIITFDASEMVKVFVSPKDAETYTGYDYTTASSGQSVNLTAPATPPYYPPGTGTQVDAYAYYPSTAGTTFTVKSDQTSDTDYKASDLMYAVKRTVTKGGTDGNDHLTMQHQMAQMQITAQPQTASGLTITRVEVIAQTTVTFAPNTANIVTTTGGTSTITALNSAGTGYVVIPPQVINGVTIRVITGSGTDAEIATYAFTGAGNFNSGDSYAIDLTVSPDQLGFTTSINNWNGVGSVNVVPAGTLTILDASYPTKTAIAAQEYTGEEITPAFIVKKGDETVDPSLYTVIWVNNRNAGKAYIIVTGKGTQEGTVGMTSFTITPANGKIEYAETAVTKTYGNPNFINPLTNCHIDNSSMPADGLISYSSSDESVATVDAETGEVTLLKAGTTTITATASNGANFVYAADKKTASYTLTINKATGNLSFDYATPSQTWSTTEAENSYTQTVEHIGDGTVTYSIGSTNTCGADVNSSTGELSFTKPGSVEVIATIADDTDRYEYASKTTSYTLIVNKATGYITLSSSSGSVDAGKSATITVNSSHGGTLSSAATAGATGRVASCIIDGNKITVPTNGVAAASVTLTITCASNDYYEAANASYVLTINRGRDIKMNPLYFMAEYNVSNSAGTAFASTQKDGYYFTWSEAMAKFAKQSTSYDSYQTASKGPSSQWHLPVRKEWWSIVPGSEANIFTYDSGSGTLKSAYITPIWGYNSTTKNSGITESSYWKKISTNEIHAIRFLGTDYCSAWKYVLTNHTLTISATLIETVADNLSAASSWYGDYFGTITFGNNESAYAIQRSIYECGYIDDGGGASPAAHFDQYGKYWSATEYNSSDGCRLFFYTYNGINAQIDHLKKYSGFTVRLFRDN